MQIFWMENSVKLPLATGRGRALTSGAPRTVVMISDTDDPAFVGDATVAGQADSRARRSKIATASASVARSRAPAFTSS